MAVTEKTPNLAERLARLETRLDHLGDGVDEIKRALIGAPERPGLIMDVDRLKQSEKFKLWALGGIGTTAIGCFVKLVFEHFRN